MALTPPVNQNTIKKTWLVQPWHVWHRQLDEGPKRNQPKNTCRIARFWGVEERHRNGFWGQLAVRWPRRGPPNRRICMYFASTLSGCKVTSLSSLRICLYIRLCLLLHHIAPRSRRTGTQISSFVSEAAFPALNFHDVYHPIAECRIVSSHFPVGLQFVGCSEGLVYCTVFVSTFWM